MATYTPNLNLKKPSEPENFTVADANDNANRIDAAFALIANGSQIRGTYSAVTVYAPNDIVTYSNSSYLCILASTGNAPTNTTYWLMIAQGNPYERYNVKKYGATGNGTTVDTVAIQNAINAASAVGGGTVFFPDGTYLTDTLTMYSNVTIMGENRTKSIIKWIDAPTGTALFLCSGTSGLYKTGMVFCNITIRHINTYTTGEKVLIYSEYSSYSVIQDCVFTDFSYSAVVITKTENTTKSWLIRNNIFKNGRNAGSRGINLKLTGEYVSIIGNMFEHIAYGVYIDDAANTLIANNQITYATSGIYITQTSSGENNGKTIITGNQINHSGSYGIFGYLMRAQADRGIVISNNQLLFNYTSGCRLCGAYSSIINGNRVSQSLGTDHGISLENFGGTQISDYNIVSNNVVTVGDIQNIATGTHNVVVNNIVAIP